MNRRIRMTVREIGGEDCRPYVLLECADNESIPAKAKIKTKAMFCEQESMILGVNRVKILGKGRPAAHPGEIVEVDVSVRDA